MVSKDCFIIGTAKIRANRSSSSDESVSHHVTFPVDLEYAEIVESGDTVEWAINQDEEEVVLSREKSWISDQQFDSVDPSTVSGNRVATIPNRLVDIHGLFQEGDRVFFVAEEEELMNDACRVVPEDDLLDVFPQEFVDRFKPI